MRTTRQKPPKNLQKRCIKTKAFQQEISLQTSLPPHQNKVKISDFQVKSSKQQAQTSFWRQLLLFLNSLAQFLFLQFRILHLIRAVKPISRSFRLHPPLQLCMTSSVPLTYLITTFYRAGTSAMPQTAIQIWEASQTHHFAQLLSFHRWNALFQRIYNTCALPQQFRCLKYN